MNGFENMLFTIQNLINQYDNNYDNRLGFDNHKPIETDSIIPSTSTTTSSNTNSTTTSSKTNTRSHSDEVAVLLSGGVDSSVALKLLLQQGYKVRAFYLKIWLEDELAHLNECPWEEGEKIIE